MQSQTNSSQDSTNLTPDSQALNSASPNIPTTDTPPASIHTKADLPLPDLNGTTSGSAQSGTNGRKQKTKKLEEKPEEDAYALSPSHQKKAEQLAAVYAKIGILVMGMQPDIGKIIFVTSLERASEVLRVARRHKVLMQIVDQIISGNDYVALVLGHVGMVGEILALHGRLPSSPFTSGLVISGRQHIAQWDMLQNGIVTEQPLYATP